MSRRLSPSVMTACLWAAPMLAAAGPADELRARIDELVAAPDWANARWGIVVVDMTTSEILYERDSDKSFMPASNMKLYTTAAALEHFGPDHRFETKLAVNGPVSREGVLRGDLVIVGGGDPSLSGRYVGRYLPDDDKLTTQIVEEWVDAVKKAGIKQIRGSVIGDDDALSDQMRSSTWQVEYLQEWYAAESGGLALNDNCWDVVIRPGKKVGDPARIEPLIKTDYVTFVNEIVTTAPSSEGTTVSESNIDRSPNDNIVTLSGEVPLDAPAELQWGSVHNGTLFTASALRDALRRAGVRVSGKAEDGDDLKDKATRLAAEKLKVIHTRQGAAMSDIIETINKPSQNFYADMVARALGAATGRAGSFSGGDDAVKDFLTTAGVDTRGFRLVDGSGLSRQNLVEPRHAIALLTYATTRPWFQAFYDSLPIAGVDGTIRTRLKGTPAENNVRAKTGYIGGVRSLSGYATAANGNKLVFCMMANNFLVPVSRANDLQDKVCVMLASYPNLPPEETKKADGATTPSAADAATTAADGATTAP